MDNIDLDNLTTIKKASVKNQNYDLRFSHRGERFHLSDRFYAGKGMNSNGFTFHLANDGEVPLLSIRPNEDSVFYKGKSGDADKGTVFSYGILQSGLKDLGLISDDEDAKYDDFELQFVKEKDGVDFYLVKPVSEGSEVEASVEAEPETEPETESEEEPKEEAVADADEEAEEVDEDDPFEL